MPLCFDQDVVSAPKPHIPFIKGRLVLAGPAGCLQCQEPAGKVGCECMSFSRLCFEPFRLAETE